MFENFPIFQNLAANFLNYLVINSCNNFRSTHTKRQSRQEPHSRLAPWLIAHGHNSLDVLEYFTMAYGILHKQLQQVRIIHAEPPSTPAIKIDGTCHLRKNIRLHKTVFATDHPGTS